MTQQIVVARERARRSTGQFGVQQHSRPELALDAKQKVHKAHKSTRDLLDAHGLSDWKVTFDNAQRRFGQCHHRAKTISLNREYVAAESDDGAQDAIRHEVAHALAGPDAGHGPTWTVAASQLGADTRVNTDPHEASTSERRRERDLAWASRTPFPSRGRIPKGTVVVIIRGKQAHLGMRASVLRYSMSRYLVEMENGEMLRVPGEHFGRVPAG